MQTIRWVLAHEPIELFIKGAQVFVDELNKKAPNKFNIEILTLSQYSDKYNNGVAISKHDLVDLLDSGDIEMSQTYTVTLGNLNKDFQALDLPFLFDSHDHATKVFEGEIGNRLLNSLSDTKNIRGLAFTYSGGFRITIGNRPIYTLKDFEGVTVRTSLSPIAKDVFTSIGAIPVPFEIEDLAEKLGDDTVTLGESTYPRVFSMGQDKVSTVVNDTKHSLFLTSILINKQFIDNQPSDIQKIIKEAAIAAANYERKLSVDDINITRQKCIENDINVIDLVDEEIVKFKELTKKVYNDYSDYFSAGLVQSIMDVK